MSNMFKQFFPILLIPMILVGAGCTAPEQHADDNMAMESEDAVMMEAAVMFEDGSFALDTAESSVEWYGAKKVGGDHYGIVNASAGTLEVEDGMITGGSITVDMSSIVSEDLDGQGKESLEEHLKSADFFNVPEFPEATFEISSVEEVEGLEEGNHRFDGSMTIKGISNDISFAADVESDEGEIEIEAEVELDRTLWEVNYGSGSIFDDLGDAVINDEFTLTIELTFEMEGEEEESEEGEDEAGDENEGESEEGEDEAGDENEGESEEGEDEAGDEDEEESDES